MQRIIDMVKIPSSSFQMGSSVTQVKIHPNETPIHIVNVPEFYIARYPVTNSEYAKFVVDTGHQSPKHWHDDKLPEGKLDHPVVNINHIEAKTYCDWLSRQCKATVRLPTEAEWEKAARGSKDSRLYSWGDQWATFRCNSKESGRLDTTAVIEYETTQANPCGVSDMLGNVWEWTDSWYERYQDSTHFSLRYGRSHIVVRGGSYKNDKNICRVAKRGRYKPDIRRPYLGFRIASNFWESQNLLEQPMPSREPEVDPPIQWPSDPTILRQKVSEYFNLSELKILVNDLGLNDDDFTPKRNEMAFELIATCQRHGLTQKLLNLLKIERPHVNWEG